jgi:hypothetical protein
MLTGKRVSVDCLPAAALPPVAKQVRSFHKARNEDESKCEKLTEVMSSCAFAPLTWNFARFVLVPLDGFLDPEISSDSAGSHWILNPLERSKTAQGKFVWRQSEEFP